MNARNRLRAENISKTHHGKQGPVKALEDISVNIESNDFVVVLGASGCGKSTLLSLLAGFDRPSQGQVTLNDRPVTAPGAERGVVFQDDALLPWLSVRDNAALGLRLKGMPRKERYRRASQMLDQVGLGGFAGQSVDALSGGMRQRLGLARALATEPAFLLMDEPLGALDALTRERMQSLILSLWQQSGCGVLMITHSIPEAVLMSTELLILSPRPGRIFQRHHFHFARRHAEGESFTSIRAGKDFTEARAEVLEQVIQVTEEETP